MKKSLSILLSVLLLLGTIGFGLSAAAEEPSVLAQGYCGAEGDGTNLSWTLTDDLTLTISGTGAMATFENNAPWDDALITEALGTLGFETAQEAAQALEDFDGQSASGFRLGARYLNAYRALLSSLNVVLEEGVTSVADGTFSASLGQKELTLPASLQRIGDYGYAHGYTKVTVLGSGTVEGLEVPAYKKDVVYPQTLQDAGDAGKYGTGIYYLSILMLDDVLPTAQTRPDLSPEELQDLTDAISAYYAASTGVAGDTKEAVFASWLDCINTALGSNLTLDDLFVAVEQDGNTTYNLSQKVEDAVMARFGYPSIIVFDMSGDPGNYMLYSKPIEQIGGEYVAAPWFTLSAPAGSATEALALEKGIPFVALCPTNHQNAYDLPTTEATEAAHGYTAGVWCPDCQTWLSGHEVIHNALGEQRVVQAPTETEEGLVDIQCTVCGEWGRYTASTTGPEPDENGKTEGGFWQRITGFFRGFIDWFLRLFHWFG